MYHKILFLSILAPEEQVKLVFLQKNKTNIPKSYATTSLSPTWVRNVTLSAHPQQRVNLSN